jgi:hypothetical protein
MTLRDLYSNLNPVMAFEPAVVTADGNGATIDTRGYDSVMLVAALGATGDTLSGSVKIELEVEHSDDGSSWSDCADADLHKVVTGTNTGTFAVIDSNTEDQAVYSTGYRGTKRYVRMVANLTGTHTNGTEIAGVAILGHAHGEPVNV